MAATSQAGQVRVAVLDTPGDGPFASGLADFIQVALQKQGVETYDRSYLRMLLAERGLAKTEVLAVDSLRRVPLPAMKVFVRGTAKWTSTNGFSLAVEAFRSSDGTVLVKNVAEGEYPRDWLATIEREAEALGQQLLKAETNSPGGAKPRTVLWMPEATSWFFRGMACYRDRDYVQAAMCFCKARQWDEGFNMARYWEIKSFRQAGFPDLAEALLGTSRLAGWEGLGRVDGRVAVLVVGEGITAAQRTSFEQGLAATKQISLLEPGWIGATAQDADLQLTGETVPRSENRNVWLAIDDVVMLEKAGQRARARRLDVLTAVETARADTEELTSQALSRLAETLLRSKAVGTAEEQSPASPKASSAYFPEGSSEAARVRALKAALEHPQDVRYWIDAADWYGRPALAMEPAGLAEVDYPPEWRMHRALLDRAITAIRSHPNQPDASFWLTSALWRKRTLRENHMVTWDHGEPLTPLKQDFSELFELFPQSAEAANLAEVLSGSFYMRTLPKDERFLQVALANMTSAREYWFSGKLPPPPPAGNAPQPLDEKQKRKLLADFHRSVDEKNYCRAWVAHRALSQGGVDAPREAPNDTSRFLVGCRNADYKINNQPIVDQLNQGNLPANASQLLDSYKAPIDGDRRVSEISAICVRFIEQPETPNVIMAFLLQQSSLWVKNYGALEVKQPSGIIWARDPVSLIFLRAEMAAATGRPAEAASECEALQKMSSLGSLQLLRARCGEGIARYNLGEYYAATELLRGVLAELEAVGLASTEIPLEQAEQAFALLRTVRLFGDPSVDFRLCCGAPVVLPLPADAKTNVATLYAKFRKQMGGRKDTNLPPVQVEDIGVATLVALVSRDLAGLGAGDVPADIVYTIGALGARSAPLAPQLVSMLLTEGRGQNNAMAALGEMGRGAADAVPVVLLCLEKTHEDRSFWQNALWSLGRLGAPPRRSMPYLARLLYHPNRFVALNAAKEIKDARFLPPEVQARLTENNLVGEIQGWWEQTGSFQSWEDRK